MKTNYLLAAAILPAACVASFAGCTVTSALGGDTSDCAGAEKQLQQTRVALAVAELGLTTAHSLGGDISLAQRAVATINDDITAIEALVNTECSTPGPVVHMAAAARRTITLADAKRLANADTRLAAAVAARAP